MADLLKSIIKLEVSGDGRTADNFNSYKVQLENALSAKEMQGIYLDNILLNTAEGVEVQNPGSDMTTWIGTATGRDAAGFATAQTAYSAWARANRVTHSYIMATLPQVLHEECAQRTKAHELWVYIEQRFSAQSLTSVAALWCRLLQVKLSDFQGVSAFLTSITKLEQEIKRGGVEVPPTLLAGAILIGMGDRFLTTKEYLLTLPLDQQNKDTFGARLLEAEKNAKISADMLLTSTPQNVFATTTRGGGCGYVRQHQGKGQNAIPGAKCARGNHKRNDCWAYMDDQFLAANPGKGPADLPNRLSQLRAKQAAGKKVAASVVDADESYGCADANSATVNLSGLSFEYTGAVGSNKQTSTAASKEPDANVHLATSKDQNQQREIKVVLDSGASVNCLKERQNYTPLAKPVKIQGASKDMVFLSHGTSTIPCAAVPQGELRGLYSQDFRHNLASVGALQEKGVDVVFPANKATAECRNSTTGEVMWTFKRGHSGLYEGTLLIDNKEFAGAVTSTCKCELHSLQHPSILLHYRLGHMSEGYMRTLIKGEAISDLPKKFIPVPKELHLSCLPCIQGKTQAKPHPPVCSRAPSILNKVHVDLVGPLPYALRGERYWLTIVDDHSRFGWTYLLHTKDQAKQRLVEWIAQVECQKQQRVKHIHGDRGGEFLNAFLLEHLRVRGVQYSFSNPDSPEQNGIAEARNKSMGRILRTLLLQSDAPRSLWGYAAHHATYLNNLSPHGLLQGHTPFEVYHGEKPSMRRLKVWGCTGHVLMNKEERRKSGGKLGPVTKTCVLLGLNPFGPGWLFLDAATNREIPSSDAVFQEEIPFYRRRADRAEDAKLDWYSFEEDKASKVHPPPLQVHGHPEQIPPAPDSPHAAPAPEALNLPDPEVPVEQGVEAGEGVQHQAGGQEHDLPQSEPRRSLRLQGVKATDLPPSNVRWYPEEDANTADVYSGVVSALVQTITKGETGDKRLELSTPKSWQEALRGPQAGEWLESMAKEKKRSGNYQHL